jgi:O-antigen/teichoic acid export membrane protein
MAYRMMSADWKKHPWVRLVIDALIGFMAGVALLALFFDGEGVGPGIAPLVLALIAGAGAAGCWRGATEAWRDLGRQSVSARVRQAGYVVAAVPAVVALPAAFFGPGFVASVVGLLLAAGGVAAWWRYARPAARTSQAAPGPGPTVTRLQ